MATRLYLEVSGSAAFSTLAFSAYWGNVEVAHAHLPCGKTKAGTTINYATLYSTTSPLHDAIRQHISGQFNAHDFTTSETIKGQWIVYADHATTYIDVSIRVVSSDGGTVRGTLYEASGPTAIPTAGASDSNRALGAGGAAVNIQNNVSMQAGDRIVIETGFYLLNGSGNLYGYYGSSDDDDAPENETNNLGHAYNPWIEFSPTLADYSAAATNIMLNII